ncbi:hypothetical protein [Aquipseudomonas guryensis]|jgi:hypothetical protein|uniref:Uncharacterized protein n=1 Tax=Aquipseudomonas guryensis TaxID=2759165 RepID=A0A7W4H515_9GAMM|nr:hypothetical protein [Pseudomonas guryensis]MBB1519897.1 hypothetical protein [Pseudomonas guryensis]
MNRIARSILLPALLVLAFWAEQKFIYEPLIVPKLGIWVEIPAMWLFATFLPVAIICVLAAWKLRGFAETTVFCLLGGAGITASQFLAGLLQQQGSHKATEGGIMLISIQLFIVVTILAAVMCALSLIRLAINRARAG